MRKAVIAFNVLSPNKRSFWSAILDSGRAFVVRVGSNVRLLKKLDPRSKCSGDLVYCWPENAQKNSQPPLCLRLIQVRGPKHPLWLLTNEFDLTDRQVSEIYASRWGVEVFFRTIKQNLDKAKLLCRTSDHVRSELTWTLLGVWASLYAAKQTQADQGLGVQRLSPRQVIDQFAAALSQAALGPVRLAELTLQECVNADESNRTTSKASRDYPRKKKRKPPGEPKLRNATQQEIEAAKMYINI